MNETLRRIRHSCAHVLAQAVVEHFGNEDSVKLAAGPATETGFFYDFLLPRALTPDDIPVLTDSMRRIIREGHDFAQETITFEEARKIFADQPFKLEIIDGLEKHELDDNGDPMPADEQVDLTTYQHGPFVDLCAGPHVENTRQIDPSAVDLLSVAGAYWRGNEKNPMLQRIYGTAFERHAELEEFLHFRREAERRDHRRLGKELELFHLDQTAPGMPYWLPRGLTLLNELLAFWRAEHRKRGYLEIASPLINEKALWETSGHWEHYKNEMFVIPIDEHTTYAVKPMNCPNAMVVFNLKTRSYRDLPLRLSDCDILHRHERSGTLHGLLRVQKIQQDDAHIFLREDQIAEEYERIFDLADRFYGVFGLRYRLRLGTRPADFMGDPETWSKAETELRAILDRRVGPGKYLVAEGDGAFYGPKIDILMEDALKREWQMGTIQLDFQLPRRFDCKYVGEDSERKTPVVVHRVIYGSLERFIGILIEHTAGAFPTWLAPVQAVVIPIADRHIPYARQIAERLFGSGLRVEVDDSASRMNAKIREAQRIQTPYMLVIGDKEEQAGSVAVRTRRGGNLGTWPLAQFEEHVLDQVKRRSDDAVAEPVIAE